MSKQRTAIQDLAGSLLGLCLLPILSSSSSSSFCLLPCLILIDKGNMQLDVCCRQGLAYSDILLKQCRKRTYCNNFYLLDILTEGSLGLLICWSRSPG